MAKRFTVAVGCYSLSEEGIRQSSYQSPKPLFAYDTNGAKQASRILAEMINGKTRRARSVIQPVGHGMKYVIMCAAGDYSLRNFRRAYLP